ncbi:hypothetical protein Dip510_000870 [Elusimicrobium posterum]|uniref:hypothetical protein n=1 Tax=Elusimicrobium posterum TaxID=3116653 RepID=UPI003C769E51
MAYKFEAKNGSFKLINKSAPALLLLLFGLLFALPGLYMINRSFHPTKLDCKVLNYIADCSVTRKGFIPVLNFEKKVYSVVEAEVDYYDSTDSDGDTTTLYRVDLLTRGGTYSLDSSSNVGIENKYAFAEEFNRQLKLNRDFEIIYKQRGMIIFGLIFGGIGLFLAVIAVIGLFSKQTFMKTDNDGILKIYPFFGSKKIEDNRNLSDIKDISILDAGSEHAEFDIFYNYMQTLCAAQGKKQPMLLNMQKKVNDTGAVSSPPPVFMEIKFNNGESAYIRLNNRYNIRKVIADMHVYLNINRG